MVRQLFLLALFCLEKKRKSIRGLAFSKFLQCMGGVKPGSILTDQCPSIEVGIRNVLEPETLHRFCSWHILHKLSTKWGFFEGCFPDLVKDVFYGSLTPSEFETNWNKLMAEIGYQNDPWFTSMLGIRHR